MADFSEVFSTGCAERRNFVARLFGLFSEEAVRCWGGDDRCRYEYIGRPTLWSPDRTRHHTLDFVFRDRRSDERFVVEMKCWTAFEGGKFRRLGSPDLIADMAKISGSAFEVFLDFAQDHGRYDVEVQAKPTPVNGAVLVWAAVEPDGRTAAMSRFGFRDVVAIEDVIRDLTTWRTPAWSGYIDRLRAYTGNLFEYLSPISIS